MSETIRTVGKKETLIRAGLRMGIAAGTAAIGAKSISAALTRAWLGSKVVDQSADTLSRAIR